MKYTRLRKYLGLYDDDVATSHNVFECGIGWFANLLGQIVVAGGKWGNIGVFAITVKDNSTEWRNKLNKHTSNAEYDLTVKRGA